MSDIDLSIVELVKEARIIKRQLKLMKNNMSQISSEDLMQVLKITSILEEEIQEFNFKSGAILLKYE